MVKSAVSDIVRCTVTTDDPLAACRDECLVLYKALAYVASATLAKRNELVCNLACNLSVVLVLKPLSEESLHLVCAACALKTLLHELGNCHACSVRTELHTETELTEVLEE